MEFTLYTDASAFAALRPEWNALLRRSRTDTIFLTWEWQSTWWECIGASRGALYVLAARAAASDAGHLIGIIPLYLADGPLGRTLQVVGCIEVSDYLDLIVEAGQEQPLYAAFLDWLGAADAAGGAPGWDALDLCNQPAATLAHTLLPELARARGWQAEVTQEDVCPIVELSGDFDTSLEGLDTKQRHEVRRKLRRLEREAPGSRVRYVTDAGEAQAAVQEFIRLHRLSSGAKDAFMTPDMASFFHEVAYTAARAGWLELSFLELEGRPLASYFGFTYRGDLEIYNSGYDPQAYPQLSPGWVLLAEVIRHSIAMGRARLDFLQGDEDYKYRFGGVDTPVYRTVITRTSPPPA